MSATTSNAIPFNLPKPVGDELRFVEEALVSGHHSGDGRFTKSCNAIFEQELGVNKALLTTSCTHALEMTAILADLAPGDEVILPSFTFVSTVNAYVLRGARPVFADVREDTLNIDETLLEALITPKTKAIVVVHYAGVACEMDSITEVAKRHGLMVIEDNAHGLFGTFKGKHLGTIGALATLSFHETKNFSCGEGGALLVNDPALDERAEIIREKGTNRSRFFRGQVDKYSWVDIGSSYLPSDILAAYLLGQLEKREWIQKQRAHIWHSYENGLRDWAAKHEVALPTIPEDCGQAFHMFYMRMPNLALRQALIAHLRENQITAPFHYLPLHLSGMGMKLGGKQGDCPVTEKISDQLLRLPFYNTISDEQIGRVIENVKSFRF